MSEPITHTTQILRDHQVIALRRHALRVAVQKGPDKKLTGDHTGDRIVIGTHPSCDVVLTDPTVSRQHLEILLVPSGYLLRDLDSTNGTFLDKVRLTEALTSSEVRLRVGDTELRISPLSDTVEVPLSQETSFGPLLGKSTALRRVLDVLRRVAPTEATVLITGESGTGKELAARAIHEGSKRAQGPFVVVDCASLPANLIESELFGHEKGAFTGAERARQGAFETAAGGTVFLDELGELPLELQARLLGAIERRRIQPLGTSQSRPIDVRLLAATNRDLRREVNRGTFREDLFFRLAVVQVEMPPLRDRPDDIELYIDSFVREWAEQGVTLVVDAETRAALKRQPWAGNVRELRNVLERAAALGTAPEADGAVAPAPVAQVVAPETTITYPVDPAVPFKVGKAYLVEAFERAYVDALLKRHGENITQAARTAEIDRVYLLRLLDKYDRRPTKGRT